MKLYILKTDHIISPFEETPGMLYIANIRLKEQQQLLAHKFNLDIVFISQSDEIKDSRFFLMHDNVYIAPRLFKKFIRLSWTFGKSCVLGIKKSLFVSDTCSLQDIRTVKNHDCTGQEDELFIYNVFFFNDFPCPKVISAKVLTELPPLHLSIKEKRIDMERARIMREDVKMEYPLTVEGIVQITHWLHLLIASQLALSIEWLDLSPSRVMWNLYRAITAFSVNKHKVFRRIVRKGRGCDIDPSAVLEGCVLGDRVTIGPNAVLKGCILGNDVEVQTAAQLYFSVLGDYAAVGQKSVHNLCVFFPRSFSTASMQHTVIGERAMITYASFVIDMAFDPAMKKNVSVIHKGEKVDSGRKFLGICLGHRAVVGTGIWINAGFEIPNNSIIVREPEKVLRKREADLPSDEPLINKDGRLISLFKYIRDSKKNGAEK